MYDLIFLWIFDVYIIVELIKKFKVFYYLEKKFFVNVYIYIYFILILNERIDFINVF